MPVVRHRHHRQRRQGHHPGGHRQRAGLAREQAVLGPEMLEGRRLLAAAVAPQFEVRWNEAAVRLAAKNVRVTQATTFGPVALLQTASATLTIVNRGTADLQLHGDQPVRFQGKAAADFRIAALPETSVVPPGGSVSVDVTFAPQGLGVRQAKVTVVTAVPIKRPQSFAIAGRGLAAPPIVDAPAAAGVRVRQVAPEYVGTGVYHALYLPTDWQPDATFPVIVEYPPNAWKPAGTTGRVEDTHLGYHQSQGTGFIWVTMPLITTRGGRPRNSTTWWDNGKASDPAGQRLAVDYTKLNLPRILEAFGGDPERVFVTGFSRGAIAAGYVALADAEIANLWLGFLPHSFHDTATNRLARIGGRASFITYGQRDQGASSSRSAAQRLEQLGFPVERHMIAGLGHSDRWILPGAGGPQAAAVRTALREWLDWVMTERPGRPQVAGLVVLPAAA